MKKSLLLLIILSALSFISHAQFMLDTLPAVVIKSSRPKRPALSTFTNKISLNNSSFTLSKSYENSSETEFILPNAIQILNTQGTKVRLDSMLIKSSPLDTGKIIFTLNIFTANKLFSKSRVRFANIHEPVSTVLFDHDVYLPTETSYIGFSYVTKANYRFSLYTNKKVPGYLYSYNKERDEFKLLTFDHGVRPLNCPQVELYYTVVE
jgi:hypothetical protein